MIAADGNGVPLGHIFLAEGDGVRNQPHARGRGVNVSPPGDVFLQNIVLHRPPERIEGNSPLLRRCQIKTKQYRRGSVYRHRGGNPIEGQSFQEHLHVLERADGNANFAHFAKGEGMIGVKAYLRGQVERHREALLAMLEQVMKTLVRFAGGAESGVLAHRPDAPPVHIGVDPPGEGKLGWSAPGIGARVLRTISCAMERPEPNPRSGDMTIFFHPRLRQIKMRVPAPANSLPKQLSYPFGPAPARPNEAHRHI